ncbi:hypothetical protein OQA88_941 [Cercophora sp. LCS_1]
MEPLRQPPAAPPAVDERPQNARADAAVQPLPLAPPPAAPPAVDEHPQNARADAAVQPLPLAPPPAAPPAADERQQNANADAAVQPLPTITWKSNGHNISSRFPTPPSKYKYADLPGGKRETVLEYAQVPGPYN